MENIFKNAYFGKPYRTKDGRKAVYLNHFYEEFRCFEQNGINHKLWVKECNKPIRYYDNGTADCTNRGFDIISDWQEEINEEE